MDRESVSVTTQRSVEETGVMSHRQVLEALSGLLLAMFVAMLSSTVVTTALPKIVADLDGTESGYTWVMVSTLLAMTATTPVWGKLADLFSKKLLVQLSLSVYLIGSLVAGLSSSMGMLIGARTIQGIGVGGLSALVQIVIATMVSPRERGRYFGYLGAVFAVATVSGPLIGGLIVDTPWLGWHWCFLVGVPVAAGAFLLLQKTLHLPVVRHEGVKIDYAGATLIVAGVSTLLIWVSLAGTEFDWASTTTAWMVPLGIVLVIAAAVVEARTAEPIIPMHLFRSPTVSLAVFASIMVGIAMFGATLFLSQYFQLARGMSPTHAGLMTLPLVIGLFISSVVSGRVIVANGRWKRWLVGGSVLIAVGLVILSQIEAGSTLVFVSVGMFVLGLGLGAVQQNLVLAVQNTVRSSEIGAGSSMITFFRTLGGAAGVSVLGTALAHKVSVDSLAGLAKLGIKPEQADAGTIPDLATLPEPVRQVLQGAYGDGVAHVFLLAIPFAVLAVIGVLCIKEVPLRDTIERADEIIDPAEPVVTTEIIEPTEPVMTSAVR